MNAEQVQEIAKFWSDVLNVKTKKIEIIFFSINPATRKEPLGYFQISEEGKYIADFEIVGREKDVEYDIIRIYLRKFEEIKVPKTIENLVYQGIVLHELLHVKCPDKSEDEIKKMTGEYLGGAYCFKTNCVFCEEVFLDSKELKKHLEDVHGARGV